MTYPRAHIVTPGQPGFYHCISRCVRQAWLCGREPLDRLVGVTVMVTVLDRLPKVDPAIQLQSINDSYFITPITVAAVATNVNTPITTVNQIIALVCLF